jgi:P-type conjugative transfer protein TrbG
VIRTRLHRLFRACGVLCVLSMTACGSSHKRVQYVRAEPVEQEPAPSLPHVAPAAPIVGISARSFGPGGGSAPKPAVAIEGEASGASYEVIDRANRTAAQGPEEAGYVGAIQEYVYTPGTLYQLYTAPMRVTDIALRPGERIIGQPVTGDVVRWVCAAGKSAENGVEQQHVYLKPTRPGLATNLVINTSERSYFLELHSYKDTYMAAVKWRYPQEEMAKMVEDASAAAEIKRSGEPVVSLEHLNFSYRIVVSGDPPRWTPTQVFDDGRRTFIRFPKAMLVREAPGLFVVREGQTQLVNYIVKRELYIVPRLLDTAELRLGQEDQEIVGIERTDGR